MWNGYDVCHCAPANNGEQKDFIHLQTLCSHRNSFFYYASESVISPDRVVGHFLTLIRLFWILFCMFFHGINIYIGRTHVQTVIHKIRENSVWPYFGWPLFVLILFCISRNGCMLSDITIYGGHYGEDLYKFPCFNNLHFKLSYSLYRMANKNFVGHWDNAVLVEHSSVSITHTTNVHCPFLVVAFATNI